MKSLLELVFLIVTGLGILMLWACLLIAGLADRKMPRLENRDFRPEGMADLNKKAP
jgi:Na+-transporting methylmalonyl-CoA/oxaloacetate decarboxylase gamma subunit